MTAGLYIHIPFCKRRCIYCDFYSTTFDAKVREHYIHALQNELTQRRHYLSGEPLQSIYIGGGTPSLLTPDELQNLFQAIGENYTILPDAEITLEANPDDLTEDFAHALRNLPVNRISLGVQSLNDHYLRLLRRRHDAAGARRAIELALEVTPNVSIDLIYGLPGQTIHEWEVDLDAALTLSVTHLSAYALTYEEGTPLWRMFKEGRVNETDEEVSLQMFQTLMDRAEQTGWEHYEISNFARPGRRARHNSGYWQEMHYLGCGPAAHSYNGTSRQWNTPDVTAYIRARGDVEGQRLYTREQLTDGMLCEETIMKRLRTSDGLNLKTFGLRFGQNRLCRLLRDAQPHLEAGRMERAGNEHEILRLTRTGLFVADDIISDLF